MLNFDEAKLEFTFKGKQYSMEYPSIKKLNKFKKQLKKSEDEIDSTIEFLCDLGAEKEVIEALRVSQLNALVEEITNELQGSKKN